MLPKEEAASVRPAPGRRWAGAAAAGIGADMGRRREMSPPAGEMRYQAGGGSVGPGQSEHPGDAGQGWRVEDARSREFELAQEAEALRLANERLRSALATATELAFTLDHELRVTWVSSARKDFDPAAFPLGKPLDAEEGEGRAALAAACREAMRTGAATRHELAGRCLALPGLAYLEINIAPLPAEGGAPGGVMCTAVDVSARKLAEEGLRKAHDDLARAQAVACIGSWRLNVQRNELLWSDECARIFGFPAGVTRTYENFLDAVHPDDRAEVNERWEAALHGAAYDVEHRILVGGRVRWVRERATLEFDSSGTLLGGFGTTQDITERKSLELALRQTEKQFRLFIEDAPAAIAMLDRDMRYVIVTRRFLEDYGITTVDLVGRHAWAVFPAMPTRWREAHQRCLDGESVRQEEDSFVRADGRLEWVRWEARPWFAGDDGKVGGTILFSENITARKEAEDARRTAQAEAERANAAKSRFLAAASHDLRQPLSALSLYVGVLDHKLAREDALLLRSIKDCVASLSELLADLLDLSKLDAGVVTPNPSDFAVDDVLGRVISAHGPEARLKGLDLRYAAPRQIARTDPVLFARIIGNLVANAVRYTERGGVLVGCRRREGKLWIEVWDTGIGIPPDKTGEIFEEFRQLGSGERTRGSGLGLAIVARMAAVLGLRLRVASKPGRGSMFAVELPRGRAQRTSGELAVTVRPLRIALVEDNPDVLQALAFSLRECGHQVIPAGSGSQLLARLEGAAPDILVCDYRLAGRETGFQVITAARAALGTQLPAMIITGDTHPDLMRSMADRGIVVQHKPLELGALQACIARLTERRASGR